MGKRRVIRKCSVESDFWPKQINCSAQVPPMHSGKAVPGGEAQAQCHHSDKIKVWVNVDPVLLYVDPGLSLSPFKSTKKHRPSGQNRIIKI